MARFRPNTIKQYHQDFAATSQHWSQRSRNNALRAYTLRQGVAHALAASMPEIARLLVTDFPTLQARLAQENGAGAQALSDDAAATAAVHHHDETLSVWANFFQERTHLIRMGNADWPATGILLQLAVEHADNSPIARAAETWLEAEQCDWVWLKRARRLQQVATNPCTHVFAGHHSSVGGVVELHDGRILSWSKDKTLRIWNQSNGEIITVLEGHSRAVTGVIGLDKNRVLSWTRSGNMIIWDTDSGTLLARLKRHPMMIAGVALIEHNRIVSWGAHHLLFWDATSGERLGGIKGHFFDGRCLDKRHIISWGMEQGELFLWDMDTGKATTFTGHTGSIRGACRLDEGRILSWAGDKTLRIWEEKTGAALAVIPESDVHQHPEIHRAWTGDTHATPQLGDTSAVGGHWGIAMSQQGSNTARWSANGKWVVQLFFPNGTIVASCDNRIAFLQLHRGNQQVSFALMSR